jgi:hypothetical protein
VNVGVNVSVYVAVRVAVFVALGTAVYVIVRVAVLVALGRGVNVSLAVGVRLAVAVAVAVGATNSESSFESGLSSPVSCSAVTAKLLVTPTGRSLTTKWIWPSPSGVGLPMSIPAPNWLPLWRT